MTEADTPRMRTATLVGISFAVLVQELALIRWLPAQVRVLAYFPNLVLLGAFLGLGIGCMRAGKRSLLWSWPVTLLATAVCARLLHGVAFSQESASEHLWLLYGDLPENAPVVNDVRPPVLFFFALAAATFVGPGQLLAERLDAFTAEGKPLTGYAWDLTGSLLGTCAFAVASFLWSPPVLWFGLPLLAAVPFFRRSWRTLGLYAAAAAAILAVVAVRDATAIYSPYYALTLRGVSAGFASRGLAVLTNGSIHQYGLPVGSGNATGERFIKSRDDYRIPYKLLGRAPDRVLVLGAGTGNDVAVALAMGARHVDAVEIDPAIGKVGALHPDRPYSSPKVTLHVTDARNFLARTTEQYDLIVFGTLDSMTRLSALASVRLDNFVYTVESLQAARAHLKPDGGVALYFMVGTQHVHHRLLAILREAFGEPPRVVQGLTGGLFSTIYMAGPALGLAADRAAAAELTTALQGVEPATDDWPYLYLHDASLTWFYWTVMAGILALSLGAALLASRELRASLRTGIDLEMFLLGLAFLLLETKSVTAMALAWGATWVTSAVVFASILLMALLGTLAHKRWRWPDALVVPLLVATLLAGWALPTRALVAVSLPGRALLSLLIAGGPVFFAAMLFASAFAARKAPGTAFGWNLVGAVAGGLIELFSMAWGLRALHLIALAAYLGVALVRVRGRAPAASGEAAPAG